MFFKQLKLGPMENFVYLIGDEITKEAAIVDPAWEEKRAFTIAEEKGFKITKILLTHTHSDHIEALPRLKLPIYVHPKEKGNVQGDIHEINEGDAIEIGKSKVKVFHTPGHTPGGVSFLVGNKLITGDAMFIDACGRIDLPGGDGETLFKTLQKIKNMDENIEIYPGHDYGPVHHATIKEQKETNFYLKAKDFDEFMGIRG